MVYKAPDVQLTKIENKRSAKEICHEIDDKPFDPDSYLFFVIYVTLLGEQSFNPDAVSSILHTRLYVQVDVMHDIFTFIIILCLSRFFLPKKHLRYHVIYVTKKIPCKTRGVSKVFLGWSGAVVLCMRTEQYYQRSFVISSSILETTTAGKVN